MIKSPSSYIIPLKKKSNTIKAIVLKYPSGYGFIGGRTEGKETSLTSLQREIKEELGNNSELLEYEWLKVENKYSFDIKNNSNRNRGNADFEEQTFYYCFVDNNLQIDFIEKGKEAKVVEICLNDISTNNFLPFQSFIDFAKNNLTSNNLLKTWKFGNTEKEANELFYLVKNGNKTATCSLYNSPLEGESKSSISVRGQRNYITNSNSSEKILIEITKVEIKKFYEIDTEFAKKEGEGDLSLKYWRKTHKEFFTKELNKQNKEFTENTLLLCEEFKIVEDN